MIDKNSQFYLNTMNSVANQVQLGNILNNTETVQKLTYDFSVAGGAIGNIDLLGQLPSKAIVKKVMIDVLVPLTSGGAATLALSLVNPGDLMAATAFGSVTGIMNLTPTIKNTTLLPADVILAIAAAALTAGKFNVFVSYVLSD